MDAKTTTDPIFNAKIDIQRATIGWGIILLAYVVGKRAGRRQTLRIIKTITEE